MKYISTYDWSVVRVLYYKYSEKLTDSIGSKEPRDPHGQPISLLILSNLASFEAACDG